MAESEWERGIRRRFLIPEPDLEIQDRIHAQTQNQMYRGLEAMERFQAIHEDELAERQRQHADSYARDARQDLIRRTERARQRYLKSTTQQAKERS